MWWWVLAVSAYFVGFIVVAAVHYNLRTSRSNKFKSLPTKQWIALIVLWPIVVSFAALIGLKEMFNEHRHTALLKKEERRLDAIKNMKLQISKDDELTKIIKKLETM